MFSLSKTLVSVLADALNLGVNFACYEHHRQSSWEIRMIRQGLLLAAFSLFALNAGAQNASEIEAVRSSHSCAGCNLFQANLSYHDLPGLDLSGARLKQSDLSLSTMNKANFAGSNLAISNMFGGRFTGASFKNADLSRTVLVGAYLGGADLSGANLSGANLSGAELTTAKGLTQDQLDTSCGDATTHLPEGLQIPLCRALIH